MGVVSTTALATSTTTATSKITTGFAIVVSTAFLLRSIKRKYFSPTIKCKLSCPCGKVQGEINAKYEDSIRIYCYCDDCRTYARYIASLGKKEDTTIGQEYGTFFCLKILLFFDG